MICGYYSSIECKGDNFRNSQELHRESKSSKSYLVNLKMLYIYIVVDVREESHTEVLITSNIIYIVVDVREESNTEVLITSNIILK
jgi:hypothetical protein